MHFDFITYYYILLQNYYIFPIKKHKKINANFVETLDQNEINYCKFRTNTTLRWFFFGTYWSKYIILKPYQAIASPYNL